MIVRAVLTLALTLAAPLAITAWLQGAHVTPEQHHAHTAAVARYGSHFHVASAATSPQANRLTHDPSAPSLSAAIPGGPLSMLWQFVALAWLTLAGIALPGRRLGRGRADQRLASFIPYPHTPPPRSFSSA